VLTAQQEAVLLLDFGSSHRVNPAVS
jgi:hypothetical protein